MRYRRAFIEGATYFFTVNLADRSEHLLVERIDDLRGAVRRVRLAHSFDIVAWTVLPDHLHAVWRLPDSDADYSLRWGLIKAEFSRRIPRNERIGPSRRAKGERGIWQRRFWEHLIRDEADLQRHVDYTHYNPVKHGHVRRVADWPYSSFHRDVKLGLVESDWACGEDFDAGFGERGEV
jgi:putative transposase